MTNDTYNDIKEINLAYLMLAQQMIKADKEDAIFRLGIGSELADILAKLTPGQVLKMAGTSMLLCQFRFDDALIVGLLTEHEKDRGVGHVHASILAANKPVEKVT